MFDEMAETAATLVDRITAATRAENRAAGERLAAISELDLVRLRQCGEHETWASDTAAAITVEIAAALRISRNWAESYLYYARAMRTRLPRVGELLSWPAPTPMRCAGAASSRPPVETGWPATAGAQSARRPANPLRRRW